MTDVLRRPDPSGLLARPHRALTVGTVAVGTVALVSLIGFEYLASFGIAGGLALPGVVVASRVRVEPGDRGAIAPALVEAADAGR